jgi:ABC-2 type transport system permease protein
MSGSVLEDRARRVSAEPLRPVGQQTAFFAGTWSSIADIWSQRELLGLLVRRELKSRYKDSSLGIVWSLIRPLAQLLIYYFAIGQVLGAARNIPSFAVFVFTGLITWTLFTDIISSGTTSIVNNSGLVKKVYLPREIFPLSSVGSALFNFAVQLIILIGATLVLGQAPWNANLLYAPLSLAVIIIFATALSLLLSAVNVYLRDIQHLVEVAVLILFWASPIVYSFGFIDQKLHGNWLEQIYLANPITLAVLGMQRAFWVAGTTTSTLTNWPADLAPRLWVALAISIVLLWLCQRIFSKLQGNFAQEL